MDLEFQRRVDRWAGAFLCRLLTLADRLLPRRQPPQPRRIMVILLSEMGSLVLAIPMFRRIREKYPEAEIHALIFERNRDVLSLIDAIKPEHVLSVRDTTFSAMFTDSLKLLRRTRRLRIDTVIDCELFSRISSIYSYLSGAAIRVGFHRHKQEGLYRGGFINRPVLYNPYQHISRQFVNMVEAIDGTGVPLVKAGEYGAEDPPLLDISASEIEQAGKKLAADFPDAVFDKLVMIYAGGGLLPIRAWPKEHYTELCGALSRESYTVAAIGMAEDRDVAEEVLTACDATRRLNLAGYTKTLKELLVLFHLAELLVTNDGGPGHFAALTPIRTIMLFGPESPVLYGPLGSRTEALYRGIPCSPCLTAYNHRNSPCDGNNVCLKGITVEEVLERARAGRLTPEGSYI